MSININNNSDYSNYVISSVNYSAKLAPQQMAEIGLEYHRELINLETAESTVLEKPTVPTINFAGTVLRNPTCTITKRPMEESLAILRKIHEDIFENKFTLEVFDKAQKSYTWRPLQYSDITISGSCAFTIFYKMINTETGEEFTSNDVDIYLMVNAKSLRHCDNTHAFTKFFINFEVLDLKYQIIKQNSMVKTNVYGFYDFDICRGCLEFLDYNSVLYTMSHRMVQAIETGICFLGFHTSDVRVNKYSARGIGIVLITGTIIMKLEEYYNQGDIKPYSIRGINAVRAVHCNTCNLMHTGNKETISAFFFNCESCWNKMGIKVIKEPFNPETNTSRNVLWAGPKSNHYFVLENYESNENKRKLIHAVRTLKENKKSVKITLPQVNITSLMPNDRKNIIKILGINEKTFASGLYYRKQRKHTIRLLSDDAYLMDLNMIIKIAKKDIVYKTVFKHIDETAVFYCSIYIPEELITMLNPFIDALGKTSDVVIKQKNYMPVVSDGRYRSFVHSDANSNSGHVLTYETTLEVAKGTYGRPKQMPTMSRKFAAKMAWPVRPEDISDDEDNEKDEEDNEDDFE